MSSFGMIDALGPFDDNEEPDDDDDDDEDEEEVFLFEICFFCGRVYIMLEANVYVFKNNVRS